MPLLESVADGRLGLGLRLPETWRILADDDTTAQVVDQARGVSWWLGAFHGVHLDVSEAAAPGSSSATHHYARFMFDDVHALDEEYQGPARTHDAAWTPMIDYERLELQGSPAIRSVHRMAYRPGREVIMGHLLIPRPWGLFEARALTIDRVTGLRESTLMLLVLEGSAVTPDSALKIPQSFFDDPARDEQYPEHCLSKARAALRWLATESGLRLDAVELPRAAEDTALPSLGCTVRPPPRFFPVANQPGRFLRTSFCGTDGIERFVVERGSNRVDPSWLARHATEQSRALHVNAGVEDLQLESQQHELGEGRPGVLVIVEGRGHQGRLRNMTVWLLDDASRPWSLSLLASAAAPREQAAAELLAAARSWRPT